MLSCILLWYTCPVYWYYIIFIFQIFCMSCISPICNCNSKLFKLFHARQNSRVFSSVDFLIMYKKKFQWFLIQIFTYWNPLATTCSLVLGWRNSDFFSKSLVFFNTCYHSLKFNLPFVFYSFLRTTCNASSPKL